MCLALSRERWISLALLLQLLAEWLVEKLWLVKKVKRVKKRKNVRDLLVVLENIYRSPGRGTRNSLGTDLTACGEEARKQEIESWSRGKGEGGEEGEESPGDAGEYIPFSRSRGPVFLPELTSQPVERKAGSRRSELGVVEARKQEIEFRSHRSNRRVAGMVWELLSVLSLILTGGDVSKQQIVPGGRSRRLSKRREHRCPQQASLTGRWSG